MKLTRVERWILSNQYRILEHLEPDDAEYLAKRREALERGYELHYDWMAEHILRDDQVMTEEESREVLDILDMYDTLQRTYKALADKSGIEEEGIRFYGFSGNDEGKQMAYARYFCTYQGERFADVDRGPDDFNSHFPLLPSYRRMLTEWKQSADKHQLSKADVVRITAARNDPSRPA